MPVTNAVAALTNGYGGYDSRSIRSPSRDVLGSLQADCRLTDPMHDQRIGARFLGGRGYLVRYLV